MVGIGVATGGSGGVVRSILPRVPVFCLVPPAVNSSSVAGRVAVPSPKLSAQSPGLTIALPFLPLRVLTNLPVWS